MPAGLTSAVVVNAALQQIAAQKQIAALNDGSVLANQVSVVYAPTVQLMLRELDPDFARYTFALVLAGVVPPVPPWAFEYLYPNDCVRLRQVRPAVGTYDPNDPPVVRANVALDIVATVNTKVILTNIANAQAVYTTSLVTEAQWDSVFTDAVVRRLANPLAMAIAGRPDFAREILEEASRVAATAEQVDESSFMRRF